MSFTQEIIFWNFYQLDFSQWWRRCERCKDANLGPKSWKLTSEKISNGERDNGSENILHAAQISMIIHSWVKWLLSTDFYWTQEKVKIV